MPVVFLNGVEMSEKEAREALKRMNREEFRFGCAVALLFFSGFVFIAASLVWG